MSFIGATGFTEYELRFQQIEDSVYIDKNDISKLYILSSNLSNNLYIGDTSITSNIINIKSYLYNGDTSITSNIIYIKNELQNETQITPTKTAIYRVKDLEDRFTQIANGYNSGNLIDPETGQIISNTISAAFSAIGASIANIGNVAAIWYFLGQCAIASQVGQTRAETANTKADRLLNIWEDSGNNVYHKKSGNVGIGTAFNSTLNNRLEVNGNINITNGNKYKINGFNLAYSNLDGFLPDSISSNFITHPILNSCNYIKTLPIATTASLGIIQVGANLSITPQGVLSANPASSVPIATTTTTGIIQVGTGLSITAQGLLSVPIATNGILGGVKPDVDTIIVNPSTGLISLSGSDIFLNGTANRAYGWASSTSLLGRVAVAGSYSTISIINDVVLRSAGNLILQSGITNPALVINATNQALFRNAVVVGGTAITSGYILDVKGDVITSGNINFANTTTSLYWGGTNSSLARAGVVGQYSTSSAVNDIILRSGNRLLLQSGTGVAGLVINTDNNVAIGAIIPLTTLDVNGNLLIRAYGTSGSGTRGIFFRSDHITTNLQYNCSILTFDHGGGGPTDGLSINGYAGISFCTGANTRQERMRVWSNGAVGIQGSGFAIVNNYMAAGSLSIGNIGTNYGGGSGWTTNTAGLMLECADTTEIAVHDSGTAVHSLMYYSTNGNITIGRNMGWGVANVNMAGSLNVSGYVYGASYVYSSGFVQGAGNGGGWRIVRPDGWVRLKDTGESTHLDFAAGQIYAHNQLTAASSFVCTASATFNSVAYFNSGLINYNYTLLRMVNISSTNTDYICCSGNTSFNSTNDKILYIANGTFTGFHRNYTDDELFDAENPDIFKNNFIGYIVISSGKIKTDYSTIEEEINKEDEKVNSNVEWKSALDKEGIFIEDALPIVKLSRVKKDKRVFGVVGDPTRSNNNKERLIINSVGEGAICVCNTNGNIENGDYIQSSDLLGHGEKQDDDILHNYTVAKATIDCNFELNSPYYECIERPDGIRTAFIACTYHCG